VLKFSETGVTRHEGLSHLNGSGGILSKSLPIDGFPSSCRIPCYTERAAMPWYLPSLRLALKRRAVNARNNAHTISAEPCPPPILSDRRADPAVAAFLMGVTLRVPGRCVVAHESPHPQVSYQSCSDGRDTEDRGRAIRRTAARKQDGLVSEIECTGPDASGRGRNGPSFLNVSTATSSQLVRGA
jgi:hypothetical protein